MECAPVGSVHVEQPVQYVPERPQLVIKKPPQILRLLLDHRMLLVMYVPIFLIPITIFSSLGLLFVFMTIT